MHNGNFGCMMQAFQPTRTWADLVVISKLNGYIQLQQDDVRPQNKVSVSCGNVVAASKAIAKTSSLSAWQAVQGVAHHRPHNT